jgi:hypothetical protein
VQEAVWAGHMEVQAASMCFACNINIYQQGQPCWRVVNFSPPEAHRCLHLSYHDGDHYNSVRLADDFGTGPPEPIDLTACEVGAGRVEAGEVRCTTLVYMAHWRLDVLLRALYSLVDAQ